MHGILEIDLPAGFYGTGSENHGKQTVPWESRGWEREIRTSTGTICVGRGDQDVFGNCILGGTTGTIFAREPE